VTVQFTTASTTLSVQLVEARIGQFPNVSFWGIVRAQCFISQSAIFATQPMVSIMWSVLCPSLCHTLSLLKVERYSVWHNIRLY